MIFIVFFFCNEQHALAGPIDGYLSHRVAFHLPSTKLRRLWPIQRHIRLKSDATTSGNTTKTYISWIMDVSRDVCGPWSICTRFSFTETTRCGDNARPAREESDRNMTWEITFCSGCRILFISHKLCPHFPIQSFFKYDVIWLSYICFTEKMLGRRLFMILLYNN